MFTGFVAIFIFPTVKDGIIVLSRNKSSENFYSSLCWFCSIFPTVTWWIIPRTDSFAFTGINRIDGCRFWNTRNISSANPCPMKSIPWKSKMISSNSSSRRRILLACERATGFPSGHISREFDSWILEKYLAGLIKPAFFMSNFPFLYVLVCNSVL